MNNKQSTSYKWAYLPFVFSSVAIMATTATAGPGAGQQYQDARQVNSINHEYVGGRTQAGISITDDGDIGVELNHIFSETENSSTSAGLWGDYDLDGDDEGLQGRGIQVNHNWVSRDRAGRVSHINKVTAAYDRNGDGHDKATVGYGQENENLFWEGHVSKGLSGKKDSREINNGRIVSDRAYDYGVGASVGTFLKGSNIRVRAGLDHEWGDEVGVGEDNARNTTLSAGIEKFFQGTPHSLALDVAASTRDGGYEGNLDDNDVTGRLSYRYDFGGASIYQPDRRYRRVRVEVPGKAVAPRYAQKPIFKRVPTYKTVPTYGKKTVRKPYKQLVKSTMELEGQTFFKLNSAKLIPSAKTRLKQIATEIRKNGYKGSIRITGNTCGLGDPVYDQRLSEQRARAVRAYLIKNGFNPKHLIARGLGKGHPKYPNTPDQGFKNRRVDIEYITERQTYKTGYRAEQQTVRTGSRQVATGFKNVPAGTKRVLISSGKPGAPRVIWKTEVIPTSPAWIKRALHNNIKHDRTVNTYQTTAGSTTTPSNAAPVAINDSKSVSCGTDPVAIDVLGNDKDSDGDNLSVLSFTQPQNGKVTRGDNGQLIYTPNGTACGQADSFQYTISDGNGHTATATVTINVDDAPADTNIAPVASDDMATAYCDAIVINVLDNDSDADDDILKVIGLGDPSLGTVVIKGNTVVYTPVSSCGTGKDHFSYTISDGHGHTATANIKVNVKGDGSSGGCNTGCDPINVKNDRAITQEGAGITIDVLANDDSGLTIIDVGSSVNGHIEILNGKLAYLPNDGFVGRDTFTYSVKDTQGQTAQASVTVKVKKSVVPTNEAPTAKEDAPTTTIDKAITIDVLANDTDPDGDNLTIVSVTQPQNASVSIVNNKILFTPQGVVGSISFSYTISDGNGHTDQTVVTVGTTDPDAQNFNYPLIRGETVTTPQGVAILIDVLANDSDADGDVLILDQVDSGSFGTTQKVNGKVLYTPIPGLTGTDEFYYGVHDGHGHNGSGKVIVIVTDD